MNFCFFENYPINLGTLDNHILRLLSDHENLEIRVNFDYLETTRIFLPIA